MNVKRLPDRIVSITKKIPVRWNGRRAILNMKSAGYPHWKQMEWIGFYFQFLCENALSTFMEIPGPQFGNVSFNGFFDIPWDFKVHPIKDAKGKASASVIINDRLAIVQAIKRYGAVGLILAIGEATFNDEDRSFYFWHKLLKGGFSTYEKLRISRKAPSRRRKTSFRLIEINFILLDDETVAGLKSFQEGFRNSNGTPRKAKLLLDLDSINKNVVTKFYL